MRNQPTDFPPKNSGMQKKLFENQTMGSRVRFLFLGGINCVCPPFIFWRSRNRRAYSKFDRQAFSPPLSQPIVLFNRGRFLFRIIQSDTIQDCGKSRGGKKGKI